MSSRVLRKLHGDSDLTSELALNNEASTSDQENDLTGGGVKKKQLNVNRYDLLNQQSLSESEVKEDDNDSEREQEKEAEDAKTSTRRKKKKKKKKSLKPSSNQRSSEDNLETDEVERSLREVNQLLGEPTAHFPPHRPAADGTRTKALLGIEHRNLNPNNELKRIFGVKIVQSEQRRRTRTRSHMRVTGLVTPKENWPHVGKQGMTMRYVEAQGSVQMFCYEHSPTYKDVQRTFYQAVESLNPDNLVSIINAHPYHVDALLQLAELCKMSEDMQMAADLVERALYSLECAFHPLFNLAQGTCQLDYRRQENRALFIALFKHLSYVGQRACHRTALELCKVLLSLDPEGDPLAMVLVIDLYALRSRQFAWLVRLVEEWDAKRNLLQLPNFAFSVAVAHFHLAHQSVAQGEEPDLNTANLALQDALIMFPGVLKTLLDKCSIQTDTDHAFFGPNAQTSQSPALSQLVQLYVARHWPVWKEADLLPWLERNTKAVIERVETNDALISVCEERRARRYQGAPPRNITRHILLADLKDVPPAISEDVHGPVMSFDPLPPLDSINIYERPQRPRAIAAANSGALTMFFRSLMPNFNVNEPVDLDMIDGVAGAVGGEGAGAEGDGTEAPTEIRRSLASLMDILRDLLRNIQLPDTPDARVDADVDTSGEDEPRHNDNT